MGWTNGWQLQSMFLASGFGFLAGFAFDGLRVLRDWLRPGRLAVFLQDFFFCVLTAVAFFFFAIPLTGGVIRAYLALGVMLGFVVYFQTFGRALVRLFRCLEKGVEQILRPVLWLLRAIAGILTCPFRWLGRKIGKGTEKFAEKVKKIAKKVLHVNR